MITLIRNNLVVCPDQQVKYPPSECKPFIYLKNIQQNLFYIFEIDGFTVDFKNEIPTAIFIKYEYKYKEAKEINSKNLLNVLVTKEKENLLKWGLFSNNLSLPLFIILWPFQYPKDKHLQLSKPVYFFSAKKCVNEENNKFKLTFIKNGDITDLRKFIREYRKYSFNFVKPIKISPSIMNCYLTNEKGDDGYYDPWPGDIDGIILSKKNKKIISILEFKTHNLETPIEDEHAEKYIKEDNRRFNVLFYLQEYIKNKQGIKPVIFFIVWGTNKKIHKKIKIQILERDFKNQKIFWIESLDQLYNLILTYLKNIGYDFT
ncbi:MAG: hypothetical protein QXG16_04815 [Candidatus Anstonellaceae archaeon]